MFIFPLDILNDPWDDQQTKRWFRGGNNNVKRHFPRDNIPNIGQHQSDYVRKRPINPDHLPSVGLDIDFKNYQPSWRTQYKIKQNPNIQSIQNKNAFQQNSPELRCCSINFKIPILNDSTQYSHRSPIAY